MVVLVRSWLLLSVAVGAHLAPSVIDGQPLAIDGYPLNMTIYGEDDHLW